MRTEELLKFDIMPFDCGTMADGMSGHITEREDTAQLAVMLRYLDLLARQIGISFKIPLINVCLPRENDYGSVYSKPYKLKAEIMKQLYDSIMMGTGWSYGTCRMDSKNKSRLKPVLSENGNIYGWKKAVSLVPDILALEQKGLQNITVIVCWSTRVARYCKYAAFNPKKVEAMFAKEDAVIRRILRMMADPYAVGDRIWCHKGNCYVMAYYEGCNGEVTISSKDIDYNFFAQGMILHLLLSHAEEMFGLPEYVA